MCQIVEWVKWDKDAPFLPDGCDAGFLEHEDAVIEALRDKEKHGGFWHQNDDHGVPLFECGFRYQVSMRHWGGTMAEAFDIDGPMSYVEWAWGD